MQIEYASKEQYLDSQAAGDITIYSLYFAYLDYLRALLPYSIDLQKMDGPSFSQTATCEVNIAIEDKNTDLVLFRDYESLIGFAVLGHAPNSYHAMDTYIQEFYVLDAFQRQGFGRKIMQELVKIDPSTDWSLFILEDNKPAIRFWNTVMPELGYEDISRSLTPPRSEDFEPKEASFIWQYWKKQTKEK